MRRVAVVPSPQRAGEICPRGAGTFIVGAVDWGERGAPVDGGEPAGIAMRQPPTRAKPPLCSQATAIDPVPRAMAVFAVVCSQTTARADGKRCAAAARSPQARVQVS